MGFRENLRETIDFCGLEQKELAHKAKTSLRNIENYLKGAIPAADTAVQIAQALGVTVEFLVSGKVSPAEYFPTSPEIRNLIKSITKLPKNKQQIVIQNALNLAGILSQQK